MMNIFNRKLLTSDISSANTDIIINLLKENKIKYKLVKKLCFDQVSKRSLLQPSTELTPPSLKKRIPTYIIYVKKKDFATAKDILLNLSFKS